jgi:hypothetical protein
VVAAVVSASKSKPKAAENRELVEFAVRFIRQDVGRSQESGDWLDSRQRRLGGEFPITGTCVIPLPGTRAIAAKLEKLEWTPPYRVGVSVTFEHTGRDGTAEVPCKIALRKGARTLIPVKSDCPRQPISLSASGRAQMYHYEFAASIDGIIGQGWSFSCGADSTTVPFNASWYGRVP